MEYVKLPNGEKMPIVGLGTWLANNELEISEAVETALEIGYRHIDTAYIYMNERVIGTVLKSWIDENRVNRSEIFIVTKLPTCGMTPEKVGHFLSKSLENLQLDYVDMYVIHVPFGLKYFSDTDLVPMKNGQVILDETTHLEAIWKEMEEQVNLGKVKAIGISNFDEQQIERIVKIAKVLPEILQIEVHAYFQQKPLRAVCQKYGINVCAYSPLGSPGRTGIMERVGHFQPASMLKDPAVQQIAKTHNKSTGQILLRFLVQQGIAVIPKSTNAQRLQDNFDILNFEITAEEMNVLSELDKGEAGRTVDFHFLPGVENHPEFPESMKRL